MLPWDGSDVDVDDSEEAEDASVELEDICCPNAIHYQDVDAVTEWRAKQLQMLAPKSVNEYY